MHALMLLRLFFESKPPATASAQTGQRVRSRAWSSFGIEWLTPVPKKVKSNATPDMRQLQSNAKRERSLHFGHICNVHDDTWHRALPIDALRSRTVAACACPVDEAHPPPATVRCYKRVIHVLATWHSLVD